MGDGCDKVVICDKSGWFWLVVVTGGVKFDEDIQFTAIYIVDSTYDVCRNHPAENCLIS